MAGFGQVRRRSFVIPILIFLNVVVYIAWWWAGQDEPRLMFMIQNFLVNWSGLAEGRAWTLLTSAFSHNMLLHLMLNMFVLNSFGPIVERVLGSGRFLRFYFVAGIVSSLCHAVVSAFLLGDADLPALGASGAISGVILLFSVMFPKERILIFGLIPVPAAWGAVLFVGLDIWGLVAQAEGGGLPIGHGAHLGGAMTGLVYYVFFLRANILKVRDQLRE